MKVHGNTMGLEAFEKLKSYYVHKIMELNICACKYHVEMTKLWEGFNNMWGEVKGVHGKYCNYNCDVCGNTTLSI